MVLISSTLSKGLDTLEDILPYWIILSSRMWMDGNKFVTSKETRVALDGKVIFCIFSTRVMEFLSEYWKWNLILSRRVFVGHLQSLRVGTLEKEAIGRIGSFALRSLFRRYRGWYGGS